MTSRDTELIKGVEELDNVIFVCFGQPKGDELPQVMNESGVIVDLIHNTSNLPLEEIRSDQLKE